MILGLSQALLGTVGLIGAAFVSGLFVFLKGPSGKTVGRTEEAKATAEVTKAAAEGRTATTTEAAALFEAYQQLVDRLEASEERSDKKLSECEGKCSDLQKKYDVTLHEVRNLRNDLKTQQWIVDQQDAQIKAKDVQIETQARQIKELLAT